MNKKRFFKVAVVFTLLTSSMLGTKAVAGYAANHDEKVRCVGPMRANGMGSHVYRYDAGVPVYCNMANISGPHEIYCASCNTLLYTAVRTHAITHSKCSDEENLCKK